VPSEGDGESPSSSSRRADGQFPRALQSVAAARDFVADHLLESHCPVAVVDLARLLTSELATNAILHADTAFEVHCTTTGDDVRIEVVDHDPLGTVAAVYAPADVSSGHGLQIVDSESRAWGVLRGLDSKTVWCELDQEKCVRSGTR
jgi:anti-sigma regulatory factor (Ser/Thr protein kinase)